MPDENVFSSEIVTENTFRYRLFKIGILTEPLVETPYSFGINTKFAVKFLDYE